MQGQRSGTDAIEIEPSDGEDYAERELPEEITEVLRLLTGLVDLEETPQTLGEFAHLHGRSSLFVPGELTVEDMLITDDSRHEVRLAEGTVHTYCILDALILPFLEEEPVEITTRPPGSEETIELVASSEGLRGGREEMVVSFGFSRRLQQLASNVEERSRGEVLEIVHEHGCPKINLFEDEAAYEAWASEADAVTMPIGLPQALALARDTAHAWDV